jgi:putative endonuclease
MAEHNELGKWGEDEATLYLENEGYVVIDRDWKAGKRDLDILAVSPDGKTLVVVEVKTRSGEEYQQPEEAVDVRKMRNLAIATNTYVKEQKVEPCVMCAGALGWAQISRVVYGASDEKRGYTKYAPDALHPKTTVTSGVLEDECRALMQDFFQRKR